MVLAVVSKIKSRNITVRLDYVVMALLDLEVEVTGQCDGHGSKYLRRAQIALATEVASVQVLVASGTVHSITIQNIWVPNVESDNVIGLKRDIKAT